MLSSSLIWMFKVSLGLVPSMSSSIEGWIKHIKHMLNPRLSPWLRHPKFPHRATSPRIDSLCQYSATSLRIPFPWTRLSHVAPRLYPINWCLLPLTKKSLPRPTSPSPLTHRRRHRLRRHCCPARASRSRSPSSASLPLPWCGGAIASPSGGRPQAARPHDAVPVDNTGGRDCRPPSFSPARLPARRTRAPARSVCWFAPSLSLSLSLSPLTTLSLQSHYFVIWWNPQFEPRSTVLTLFCYKSTTLL